MPVYWVTLVVIYKVVQSVECLLSDAVHIVFGMNAEVFVAGVSFESYCEVSDLKEEGQINI